MIQRDVIAVILAAGQGKRMNSKLPKVAHELCGKPLISWVIDSLIQSQIKNILPVIAPTQKLIEEIITKKKYGHDVKFMYAYQEQQLGTAHAVQCAIDQVEKFFTSEVPKNLKILIVYGDTPAVKSQTFNLLIDKHETQKNIFTILAFKAKDPFGYGRIITSINNQFIAIREQKDCSPEEELIDICNSGILCANFEELKNILPCIKNNNSAKEFYLTDIPFIAKERDLKIGLMVEEDESQFLGINTQEQLKNMESYYFNLRP